MRLCTPRHDLSYLIGIINPILPHLPPVQSADSI